MAGVLLTSVQLFVRTLRCSYFVESCFSSRADMEEFDEKADLLNTFLNLEEIDTDLYRSTHQLRGRKAHNRVFGGQVVGQALMAAYKTVDKDFLAHSLHCYFIEQAIADRPIVYQVSRIRDGKSFLTRVINARQNGKTVCTCSVSYQKLEADSISHQYTMPDVPSPDLCEDSKDFKDRLLNDPESVSEEGMRAFLAYQQVLNIPSAISVRLINPKEYISLPTDRPMKFACWVKNNTDIGLVDHVHHCVAAFISDIAPVGTPLLANAAAGFKLGMAASLDHSMWFHRPDFRIDNDWMLYETESTISAGGRALIQGKMWTRDGRMVISSSQEILIRAERKQ